MNEMKYILLTIITEGQSQMIKAEKLSKALKNELGEGWEILTIENYYKFEASYKIEFKKLFIEKGKEEIGLSLISISDRIASPWLVYYDKAQNTFELIFNKKEDNQIRKIEFNVIKWGQFQIVE